MYKYASYILYLLISILVVFLYLNGFSPLESLQRSANDFLCRVTASETAGSKVVFVTVDKKAQKEFGQWPWNHDLIADLLAATASGEPRTIMLDFVISENASQDSAGYTDILAGQLSWIENLVIPYDIALARFRDNQTFNPKHLFDYSVAIDDPLGTMSENASLQVRKVFLPARKVLRTDPYLGFDYTMPDNDRVLRHESLVMNYGGYYYPSTSLLSAALYLGLKPEEIKVTEGKEIQLGSKRTLPINDKSEFFIKFVKEGGFKHYSAADVLGEGFDFKKLNGKLVVIDYENASAGPHFRTPVLDRAPKSLVKATVAENIINDNILAVKDDLVLINLLILFVIGGACAFALPQVSLLYRAIILAGALVILANVNYFLLSSFGVIVNTVYFAAELFLFMLASPLLDSQLIKGTTEEKKSKHRSGIPRIQIDPAQASDEQTPAVRELNESPTDQENLETKVLSGPSDGFPEDHQAINIDVGSQAPSDAQDSGPVDEEPPAEELVDSSPLEVDEPTIITSDSDSAEIEVDPTFDPAAETGQIDSAALPTQVTHLGRYQITGTLGKGAMGHVYKGIDPAIDRPVALKTIRLDFVNDPDEMAELKERLFREAQAAGKLSHPNIVTIYDVGSEGHLQYIAMEYLKGLTLDEMIKKKTKFNYKIIAQIIVQICSALEYAHEQGIVHRDIKPANIMVLKDYRIKVMDYGIARIDSNSMTKTGIAMGTPNYISPEQLKGLPVDQRADIFSLGVVFYEMLLGRRPFRGENLTSLIYSTLNQEPEKPSNVNPQIPLLFDHIIDKALQKAPADRYQKAKEIVSDLNEFVESFVT